MTTEKTGLRNPGCYAQALADCCDTLSREHYMTESLLKAIALDDEIEVEGAGVAGGRKQQGHQHEEAHEMDALQTAQLSAL
jgi:hypothetical protein